MLVVPESVPVPVVNVSAIVFVATMLILETGMNGTFVAQDLILFFVFFEVVLLPMYFMIGVWGGPNREYASIKWQLQEANRFADANDWVDIALSPAPRVGIAGEEVMSDDC